MGDPARKRATYADIQALPPNVTGQIIAGVLYTSPRPSNAHGKAATSLSGELWSPFQRGRGGPGGWIFITEPELRLDKDILVPDIAGWHGERVEAQLKEKFFSVAPDWVCEILSPSTAGVDRVRKMPVYFRENVRHVWLLDPVAHLLEAFRRQDDGYKLIANFLGDEKVRVEPFDAIELNLADLWVPGAE